MTGYQISAMDLNGFKKCNAGLRAMNKYEEYRRTAERKRLTPADKLARIEALERKAPVRNLASVCAGRESGFKLFSFSERFCADERVKGNFPIVSAMLTVVFACILMLVVYSSVQYSDAKRMYNDTRDSLAASDAEIVKLEGERDARVDLREVERIAVEELGMIQKDKADRVFVSIKGEDSLILEDKVEKETAEASLLSAFAERLKALWEYLK
ncbi:MAG: hypothetical protein E7619_01910 [Ruminococcaceae bacterium]|nr:hypothetical protein [Oscillospiraceae bacterium]